MTFSIFFNVLIAFFIFVFWPGDFKQACAMFIVGLIPCLNVLILAASIMTTIIE